MLKDIYGPDEDFLNREKNAAWWWTRHQTIGRALSVSQHVIKLEKMFWRDVPWAGGAGDGEHGVHISKRGEARTKSNENVGVLKCSEAYKR